MKLLSLHIFALVNCATHRSCPYFPCSLLSHLGKLGYSVAACERMKHQKWHSRDVAEVLASTKFNPKFCKHNYVSIYCSNKDPLKAQHDGICNVYHDSGICFFMVARS